MFSIAGLAIDSVDDGMCPAGGNKCFMLVHDFGKDRRTWAEALEICRSGHLPDLASVTSEAHNGKQSHQSVHETTLINACT